MIQILPLGAGQDVGRSCIIVTMGGRTIMFDCGMHMGFNDERRFPDFTPLSITGQFDRVIDLVIISHFHLDHCGALPYFTEMCGYNGPILMTGPTKDICPILLEDFRKITVERRGESNFFTASMIQACMNKVSPVPLGEQVFIADDFVVKAYYAGHVLGAAMFYVKVGEESVLYTGDYNMTPDRHLGGAIIDRCNPDVLITESTYAATIRDSKRARERDFLKKIHQCVACGGKVLVPTFALGRVQELCILIDSYWKRAGLHDIPVYFTGGMAEMATKYYRNYISWTNEAMLSVQQNPFDFTHIQNFEKSFINLPGPMVVFSTPGMLHSGMSLEIFKAWCEDPKNLLIVPGYCVGGTVGAKVLAGMKQIELVETKVRGTTLSTVTTTLNVNIQVKNLSFSAHVDAKGILQLISQCRPKNVVLVHGEAAKMQVLKSKISDTFHVPSYDPANGEFLNIETDSSVFKKFSVSNEFVQKRRFDVAQAAEQLIRCPDIPNHVKSDLLYRSIELQCRPDLIQFDGSLHFQAKTDPMDIPDRPLLVDDYELYRILERNGKIMDNIITNSQLVHSVKRFFHVSKFLEAKRNLDSVHCIFPLIIISKVHALLLQYFNPQINVSFDQTTSSLSIHSMRVPEKSLPGFALLPLVLIHSFNQITPEHMEYQMDWAKRGETIAKIVIQIFNNPLDFTILSDHSN